MTEPLSMDQAFIKKLTDIVLANLANENHNVEKLAMEIGLTRVALYRKLRSIKHQDVTHFIREVRLQRAMEMLRNNEGTVTEIAFRVGFGSPAYFNKCFHTYFGYPPGEVRKRILPKEGDMNEPIIAGMPESNHLQSNVREMPATRRKISRKVAILLSMAAIVVVTITVVLLNVTRRQVKDLSIVVLPFKNLNEDKETQYFTDGIMDDIINNLFRISNLRVLSATTSRQFRESNLTAPEIARKLNVNYAIEGSVQKYGSKVRIFIQLIDARSDQHLLSDKYDREFTDIFNIQSDISKSVANKLEVTISSKEIKQIEKIPTRIPEAYIFYLQGRLFLNQRKESGFRKSLEYFEKAVAADTSYALAYAGLADAYFLLAWYNFITRPEGYIKAKEYALKALIIDEDLSEAHTVLGGILTYGEWKWEEARKELQLSVELNPNFVTAHAYYSELLDILRENTEARRQINIALELDPFFPTLHALSALYYHNECKFENSVTEYRILQELDPGRNNYWQFFNNYIKMGEDAKAVEMMEKAMSLHSDTVISKSANLVKDIYDSSGLNGLLKWQLQVYLGRDPIPLGMVVAYTRLGRKEEALNWLERYFESNSRDLPRINNNPELDNLRSEPRFLAIIEKMGLSDYK